MRRLGPVLALTILVALVAAAAAGAGRPKLWFAPLPPDQPGTDASFVGSVDFMKLFSKKAPWKQAAGRVAVFKLYGGWVARGTTDAWLRRAVGDLKRRKIALAVEEGPLLPTEECGREIEGFAGEEGVEVVTRVRQAGGTLRYLAFDEPFFYASIYDGPRACHWPAERVAEQIADYVEGIREVFPRIAFGDTEPLTSAAAVAVYTAWCAPYRRVVGGRLAFFHLDVGYYLPNWPALAKELEEFARSRGVPFGMIYFGEPIDASDAAWLARAQARFETYETAGGGAPDHALLQSWQDRPDRVLPETGSASYTNLILRYARPRPTLSLEPVEDGSRRMSGRLKAKGRGRAGARIAVAVTPLHQDSVGARAPLVEVATTTDAAGRFAVELPDLPSIGVLVEARYPGSKALWPAFASVELGTPARNIALGRPATASKFGQAPAGLAVDGNYETSWGAGDDAPQWIEVDLGVASTIAQIRLVTEQFPAGETVHRILGRSADGTLRVLQELRSVTDTMQVLEVTPATPWTGIRAIRVETVASPSWVAWREIEVWS